MPNIINKCFRILLLNSLESPILPLYTIVLIFMRPPIALEAQSSWQRNMSGLCPRDRQGWGHFHSWCLGKLVAVLWNIST